MRKTALLIIIAFVMFACGQQVKKQEQNTIEVEQTATVLTIDELVEKAEELAESEVVVKGTVMHVCQHGGQRCFLMGSSEDVIIRVEAGEKIGSFSQEQMGSELQIVGIFKEVKTEAEAHNPGREHGDDSEGEHMHDEDAKTEEAHQTIAKSQETIEKEFFIEGMKVKEI